ncbi:hypothetical protein BaRGS_00020279 [Batillaria attramentaria]|uniref:PUM-HD domain-containing protein n=1 Tax=Batillaria attramentaria TaxID=370345 RepID=A0ABD0KN18_9CAEN
MRKQSGQTSPRGRVNRSTRTNPEGVSLVKKEKLKLGTTPPQLAKPLKSALKKGTAGQHYVRDPTPSIIYEQRMHTPRRGQAYADDTADSSLEQTPESLSQISSIMPVDDSTMMSTFHRQSKVQNQSQSDTTWEMAVDRARGEPDGAETSFRKKSPHDSPRTSKSKKLEAISEEAESPGTDKENSKKKLQSQRCMKVPLKQAGKKLKSLKTLKSKKALETSRLSGKSKSKRKFDETLPDETIVPKKAKLTWKEKKKERKMVKNNYDLIQTAKGIWEELRRQNLTAERRQQLCKDMHSKVQGKVKELAVVHDSARIIQCLVQYGSPEQRAAVLEEIKDHIVDLCKNKYAKFIIRKLLKYGSKPQKALIIKAFHGHVRKLIRHKEASDIVEYAYNDFANALQRLFLLEEFYGPAFSMFKTHTTRSLDDVLLEQQDKIPMVMHNLKETLLPLIDKQILAHSMVHKIFFDFFKYADESLRKDMIEALRESVIHMLHTREGARVAMACVWHGSAKDRKVMIKSLKGHVVKICKEEAGHLALLAMFDVVDDTVLVQKVILDEILKNLTEVMSDNHGRKVLLYLLVRRDQAFFCPDIIHVLQLGDANTTSKKDPAVRAHELRDYVSGPLIKYLKENAKDLIMNSSTSLLVPAIAAHATGDMTEVLETVANIVVESSTASSGQEKKKDAPVCIVEDVAGHMTVKKLIMSDRQRMLDGDPVLFSSVLLNAASSATLKSWAASNRGCFILVNLLEVDSPEVTAQLKAQMAPLKKYLKKMTFKGAEILLQKLDGQQTSRPKSQPREISL